ncbi:CYTH and CHAD domain-containing protein [Rathayibacter sp. VKM Ac-2835]|uniref:CYTH and CHAD domain-containing protein n=1 Tax=Rathayibacter sp. VKM Ac-2835 TaxID=2739043 RepID=UPI0015651500|nr:CYTH and CHAD domain-containing protein [Rathayibacter sp. VKM Ac-2835]NRG39729.1 CYTH and CHAD domain-containing protein [Rathayibacter sp. VKM Ac-2835]
MAERADRTKAGAQRRVQTEVERKYDVGADTALPDLIGAGAVASARAEEPVRLWAQYFDTADRALSRGRITLRRREGGEDEGWHVKLPGSSGRTEIHAPLTASRTVPAEVREPVLGHVGRSRLEPLATLETVRAITRVADSAGRRLAEIADDLVIAHDQRSGVERRWREWEVELVDVHGPEGEAVLDAIEERLLAAGARPAESASKLARATGGPIEDGHSAAEDGGEAALAAIRELLAGLRAVDPRVRLEADDALHRMRLHTRRLRSVLAASRSVLDREALDPLRDELRWLGGVLGAARDEEVLAARLRTAVQEAGEGLPAKAVAGTTLFDAIERRQAVALQRVAKTLRGARYLALLDSLDALLADPPRTAKAAASAKKLVRRSLAKELSRVDEARSGEDDLEARHEVRKAAKRLRYVVEAWSAVVPAAVGSKRRRLAKAAEAVADALGEERDALAARDVLRGHALVAARRSEPAFALGAASAREETRAREAAKAGDAALERLHSLSS